MPSGLVEDRRPLLLDTIDSTNAEALRRARGGERGPLWIVARRQSAGRGRRGRPWISPPGNLYASLLLTDPAPAAAAPQLGFVAGLALHDAAAAAASLAPRLALKWPNDLLCAGRKIAGILVEGEGNPVTAVIGIGVNCCAHPVDAEYPATDFAAQGADVAAMALFDRLAAAMAQRLCQWRGGSDFAAIRIAWLDRAAGRGEPVRVRLPDHETAGIFEAIDTSGRLILRRADGTLEAIAAGEVFPLQGISAQSVGAGLPWAARIGASER
jgi:BirA family transcriptional regulator, biotin operon repressor / biotin---[acetyl-CoA-carboxylase] ligase